MEEEFSIILDKEGEIEYIKELFKGKRFFRKITQNILESSIAEILLRNPHPNIVKIYRISKNKNDDIRYTNIDMEILNVRSQINLQNYKTELENAKNFIQSLGIAYIDWKRDNIGLTDDEKIKIFDFDMSALYDIETNTFIKTPLKGYLWTDAVKAGIETPKEMDDWIFYNKFY